MPVGVVKNDRDEALWAKAKAIAAKAGHEEDWQYVMGVYKKMHGGELKKTAGPIAYLKNLFHAASGAAEGPIAAAHRRAVRHLVDVDTKYNKAQQIALHAGHKWHKGVLPKEKAERVLHGAHRALDRRYARASAARSAAEGTAQAGAKAHAESSSAKKKLILGLGGLAAGGVIAKRMLTKTPPQDQEVKVAADKKEDGKVNWKRLALMGAGMGLLVGGAKGYVEEAIKSVAAKRLAGNKSKLLNKLRVTSADGAERAARGLGRGLTSAGGGVVYATGTAMGLKKDSKKDKK